MRSVSLSVRVFSRVLKGGGRGVLAKNYVNFSKSIFKMQHADIVSAFELEKLDQISTSMQSRRQNECADLII